MTPKEKANELVDKFMDYTEHRFNEHNNLSNVYTAKQCALIAVYEILNALDSERIIYGSEYRFEENKYWQEVKQEIQAL